jgi:hypothetical protein
MLHAASLRNSVQHCVKRTHHRAFTVVDNRQHPGDGAADFLGYRQRPNWRQAIFNEFIAVFSVHDCIRLADRGDNYSSR